MKSFQNPLGQGEHDMFKELPEVTIVELWSACEGTGWKRGRDKDKSHTLVLWDLTWPTNIGHVKEVGFYFKSH